MTRSRQLAAIMFTDIEGYTTLMQQNEEKAIQARDKHRLIFNTITEKHNGRILQYYGQTFPFRTHSASTFFVRPNKKNKG